MGLSVATSVLVLRPGTKTLVRLGSTKLHL